MFRAQRDKRELTQLQQTHASTQLPVNVRDARDHLDDQLKAVITAMSKRDNAQANQELLSTEDSLTVIEKYLGQ